MRLIVGMVESSGARRVLSATAEPSLDNITDLTDGGADRQYVDWGHDADEGARERLAAWVLGAFVNGEITGGAVIRFARDVIGSLQPGRMFILSDRYVQDWILSRMVN